MSGFPLFLAGALVCLPSARAADEQAADPAPAGIGVAHRGGDRSSVSVDGAALLVDTDGDVGEEILRVAFPGSS